MVSRVLISAALVMAASLTTLVRAGALEDGLLAGAAARLDLKGVELALRRGAKAAQGLPHPDAPTVIRTPVQFALSALIGSEETDAPQRADRAAAPRGVPSTRDRG